MFWHLRFDINADALAAATLSTLESQIVFLIDDRRRAGGFISLRDLFMLTKIPIGRLWPMVDGLYRRGCISRVTEFPNAEGTSTFVLREQYGIKAVKPAFLPDALKRRRREWRAAGC